MTGTTDYIVVTGAAGFIGSHLVDRLLHDGQQVVGIDCFTDYYDATLKRANLACALGDPRFTLIERDLLDLLHPDDDFTAVFRQAGCVYHLAAQAGVRASWGAPSARTPTTTCWRHRRSLRLAWAGVRERSSTRRPRRCTEIAP